MLLRFLLFPGIWAFIIALFTIMPGKKMPSTDYFLSFDKFAHAFVFAVQVFLLIVAFAKQYSSSILKQKHVFYGLAFPIAYGILIEFIQSLIPERGFSIADMFADTAGCFLGYLFFYLVYKL